MKILVQGLATASWCEYRNRESENWIAMLPLPGLEFKFLA
jgi:hypothetical protein